jgi:hypothetical protein
MDLLADQLNDYSRHGIPRLPHLLTFEADEDTEEALYRYRARIMLALVDWSGLCRWVKFLLIRGPSRLFFVPLSSLEEDWKLIVMDWTLLPERQRQQQNAIWELVQTEVAYLRTLKVITDVSLIRSIAPISFCLRPSSSIRLCENDGGLFSVDYGSLYDLHQTSTPPSLVIDSLLFCPGRVTCVICRT